VEYSPGPPEKKTTHILSSNEREAQGWFKGPPYAVAESVFDKCEMGGCSLTLERE
jgi:hypothetical protein